jgi:hypothetical protein
MAEKKIIEVRKTSPHGIQALIFIRFVLIIQGTRFRFAGIMQFSKKIGIPVFHQILVPALLPEFFRNPESNGKVYKIPAFAGKMVCCIFNWKTNFMKNVITTNFK